MINLIKKLIDSLSLKEKVNLFLIQILLIITTFFEILSIYTIAPFLGFVSGFITIENSEFLKIILKFINVEKYNLTLSLGVILLIIYLFSIFMSFASLILSTKYANKLGAQINYNIFRNYLNKPTKFFFSNNSSNITSNLLNDSTRINQIIIRLMIINNSLSKVLLIIIALALYNFEITFTITITLTLLYFLVFNYLKKKIALQGKNLSTYETYLTKLIKEGFGSFRDIAINKKQIFFSKFFLQSRIAVAKAKTKTEIYSSLPRFFIEGVGFSIVISLIIFLSYKENNYGNLIVTMSIFGISLLKLLPSFQNIYYSLAEIKSALFSFEKMQNEINFEEPNFNTNNNFDKKDKLKKFIFKNVSHTYENNKLPSLNSLNLEIKLDGINVIIGKTGSGKSTFLNLCLGLLNPSNGEILIDEFNILKTENKNSWHKIVSYVPQSPFMLDSTIKENIAYEYQNIDKEKIDFSIKQAELENFINSLDKGLDTIIGENGVNLSGGQIQRIAIARAIYSGAKTLFLDEATNALDHVTENLVWRNFQNEKKNKSYFIISHNLHTLKYADNIILIEDGHLSIIELSKSSERERNNILKDLLNKNLNV